MLQKLDLKKVIDPTEKYLLSFSAGPDSCFLLHMLSKIMLAKNLYLIYFDHDLRSRTEIEHEKEFTVTMAEKYSTPYFLEALPVTKTAYLEKKSIETAARDLRQRFLIKKAKELGMKFVLTAHHFDDALETMLFRLARGVKSNLFSFELVKEFQNIFFLKPLIKITKKEILEYLAANEIPYLVDKTNQENIYSRNRIRNQIVPVLEEINPSFRKNVRELSSYFSEYKDFLKDMLKPYLQMIKEEKNALIVPLAAINKLHPFLQKELLHEVAVKFAKNEFLVESKHIEKIFQALKSNHNFKLFLHKNTGVIIKDGKLIFTKFTKLAKKDFEYFINQIPAEIFINELNLMLKIEVIENNPKINFKLPGTTFLSFDLLVQDGVFIKKEDACQIALPLIIRNRKPGDRFYPFGLKGQSKTLKKYLIDKKIKSEERDSLPLLFLGHQLLAILGVDISYNYRVRSSTKLIFKITFRSYSG